LQSMLQLAEADDTEAQYWLGACYAMGDIVQKDNMKAVQWYTKAAEKGHAEAQYNLGTMIIQGEGTEKNLEKGIWWMEQAVANGYEYSAYVLSLFYHEGIYGINRNSELAQHWKEKSGTYKDKP
jgi:uncharacterized protein